jgi:hypothetical protein
MDRITLTVTYEIDLPCADEENAVEILAELEATAGYESSVGRISDFLRHAAGEGLGHPVGISQTCEHSPAPEDQDVAWLVHEEHRNRLRDWAAAGGSHEAGRTWAT